MVNRVMSKDNIAVGCVLENPRTQQQLMVCNVHIFWDPAYRDVKLVQTALLMDEIKRFMNNRDLPLVIAGDFNSLPDSGVYEFLARGHVGSDHSDLDQRLYGDYAQHGFKHDFSLRSCYSHIGELTFTNYTSDFRGVIDYVWYSSDRLAVSSLLGNLDDAYVSKCVGFPNSYMPSDHIALAAVMRFGARQPLISDSSSFSLAPGGMGV
jgi:CCR4-NOT transcription complex subunit 6